MTDVPFDVVLFDLGGVLVEFSGVEAMGKLAEIEDHDELWSRWLACEWVRAFESGRCSPEEFAAGMVREWALPIGPEGFLDSFRGWAVGPLPGADVLVDAVRQLVRVGCLSNTNVLHWEDHFSLWPILDSFDVRFLSFELGLLKPDRELFDRVAQLERVPPNRVLFLDDNAINVAGAISAGFAAVHVRGVEAAEAALVAAGVLRPLVPETQGT